MHNDKQLSTCEKTSCSKITAPSVSAGLITRRLRSGLLLKQPRYGCTPPSTVRALTLVELLVTITIMGLVIAISIPMVKPMLATNKVKSGADMVAGFLAQARNRAIEEGRPVGVTFERVLNYGDVDADGKAVFPYNGASVLMRQVAEPKPLSGFVKDVRVAVSWPYNANLGIVEYTTGTLVFYIWNGAAWSGDSTESTYWNKLVETGDLVQFDARGPKYEIMKGGGFQIDMTSEANRNLAPPVYSADNPALFKVFRKPQPGKVAPTMAPPVAMPEGIVVDLDCSGMGNATTNKAIPPGGMLETWFAECDDFSAADAGDRNSVTIMFSPTGEVDRVYYSDPASSGPNYGIISDIPSGPIFLNIGIWERAGYWDGGYISNDYLPEGRPIIRNYHDMNNYWVTVFPRTGAVRVNRVYLDTQMGGGVYKEGTIKASRKFADSMHSVETR